MNFKAPFALLAICSAIALAGCSNIPVPVVPDGSSRQAINSEAKIEDFKAHAAADAQAAQQRDALSLQVDSLRKQVADLKTYLMMQQIGAQNAQGAPAAKPATSEPATPLPAMKHLESAPTATTPGGEAIEVRGQSVVFRVTHPFGKTEFSPSPDLQSKLLKAAREAKHIDIRGRTDAQADDAVDRDIALQRALRARRFLVANGVEPAKIRWSSLASGGRVADNSTADGRAKNRRVEIETMDVDTTAFLADSKSATMVGSAQ